MLIRSAKPEDAGGIARAIIMAEGMEMISYVTGFGDAERAEEKYVGWILSPVPNRYSLQHALVAEIDGRTAGTLISFPADSQPALDTIILEDIRRRGVELKVLFFEGIPGTYYLSIMGVEPERRKKGVGTALMTAAREGAKNQGFARASLLVEHERPRVRALYERQGFRAVEEVILAQFKYWRMALDLWRGGARESSPPPLSEPVVEDAVAEHAFFAEDFEAGGDHAGRAAEVAFGG